MYVRKRVSRGTPKRQVDQAVTPVCTVRRKQTYGPNPTAKGKDGGASINIEEIIKEYVERAVSKGVEGFKNEFKSVCSYRAPDHLYKYDSFSKNPTRNRYERLDSGPILSTWAGKFRSLRQFRLSTFIFSTNVLIDGEVLVGLSFRSLDIICLESSRVRLTQDVPPSTDYIHANWVKFEKHDRVFIATQAPLDNTIDDFWRMVFQERCPSIVNLTQMIEKDKMRCILYWPQHAGSFNTYDKMFVNTKKIEFEEQCAIYTIELVPEGCSDSHIVKLIHMTNWPDKGVPASGRHVLRILRMVVANKLDCGPIVVHCSAGVGRTGSIILIDIILRKLFSGEQFEMVQLFKQLRDQRANSINMPSLYVFVVYSVLDYIRAKYPAKYKEKTQKFFDEFKAMHSLPR